MKRRRRLLDDLDQDIRDHLEQETRENIARGLSPDEARHAALRTFGNLTRVKEEARAVWYAVWLDELIQDLRYGLRMLRRSPGFTAVAVLTLALGIGANTAIFSLIDAVMLRAIPVKDPQSLVLFQWQAHKQPGYHDYQSGGDCGDNSDHAGCSFSMPFFEAVRAHATTFSSLAAFFGPVQVDLSGAGQARVAQGELVSGDFFSTLGVNVILGRPIGPEDDSPNAPPAMVLDYQYWRSAFDGERSVVGRTVRVNDMPVEIVGVASPRFTNLAPGKTQDFFLPISAISQSRVPYMASTGTFLHDPYAWWLVIVGRKKPGTATSEAQAATTIFRNELLHGAHPMSKAEDDPRILLAPVSDALTGERGEMSSLLYLMMIAVGAILLIACANVAGLMLARSASRQREMALRLALGAGRGRIVRQLLTESAMLSAAGGAVGALLAVWSVHAIGALLPAITRGFVVEPDARVLAFTFTVTFLAALLVGLAPALRGTRVDLTPALKEATTSRPADGATRTGRRPRLGGTLVVAQVALSVVVLVGAGLLVRTLQNLREVDPGFDTRNVLLFGLDPGQIGYNQTQSAQLFRDLRERFAALPGVLSASYSSMALLSGGYWSTSVHLEGAPSTQNVDVDAMAVGPAFLSTMHIPLVAGRRFTPADFMSAARIQHTRDTAQSAAERAAIRAGGREAPASKAAASVAPLPPMPILINEALARKYFTGEDPVGRHLGNYESGGASTTVPQPGYVIVGVCGNTKYNNLRRAIQPTIYQPFTGGGAHFELRTASSPAALIPAVRRVVARADGELPLFGVRTQIEQIDRLLVTERLMARIGATFALLALALACLGLYGLLSYEVVLRTREIGTRMALGAQPRDVLTLLVRQGLVLALAGTAIGVGVAIGVTRFMISMLYGVHANDPATIVAVSGVLGVVAVTACVIPARRAMRIDPVTALRWE